MFRLWYVVPYNASKQATAGNVAWIKYSDAGVKKQTMWSCEKGNIEACDLESTTVLRDHFFFFFGQDSYLVGRELGSIRDEHVRSLLQQERIRPSFVPPRDTW